VASLANPVTFFSVVDRHSTRVSYSTIRRLRQQR
jgi:hypothetical protein